MPYDHPHAIKAIKYRGLCQNLIFKFVLDNTPVNPGDMTSSEGVDNSFGGHGGGTGSIPQPFMPINRGSTCHTVSAAAALLTTSVLISSMI